MSVYLRLATSDNDYMGGGDCSHHFVARGGVQRGRDSMTD